MPDSEHGSGDVLARLEAMASELPEAIADLEQQRNVIDEQLKRLRTLHRTLSGEASQTTQAKAKAGKSPGKSKRPSQATLNRVANAAIAFNGTFTARELRESMGKGAPHDSLIHIAIKHLREIEFLGAAGKRKSPDAPRPSEAYRVLDAEALSEERPNLAAVA